MKAYIRSTGNVSPQHSLDKSAFYTSRIEASKIYFECVEPDYDRFVDSRMIRRMSRIVKMGVAAAITSLRNAGVENPGAILTATAYGCLEDSSSFLRRMIEFDEKMLSPTAFIQSTHNTVGAQIALMLKCHQYNNTIVHRSFSFENALTEAGLLLQEKMNSVLVGAVDEMTRDRQAILSRFGLYKKSATMRGNIAGEGAAFFVLENHATEGVKAVIRDVQTFYEPETAEAVVHAVENFLNENGLSVHEIGLVLTAHTGNEKTDRTVEQFRKAIFEKTPFSPFKSLCGDYPTATGFALWFATILMEEQKSPSWLNGIQFPLRHIFIHNYDGLSSHSFLLVDAL